MKSIEIQAKTIEQAVEEGLEKLGCSYDEVDVEVVSNGGMFKKAKVKLTIKEGIVQKPVAPKAEVVNEALKVTEEVKPAPVKEIKPVAVEKKHTPVEKVEVTTITEGDVSSVKLNACLDFVKGLVTGLGHDVQIFATTSEKAHTININGDDVGRLIGKGGEALNALQTLVSSIAISNSKGESKRVYVNVENYKEKREETLKNIAGKKSDYVLKSGKPAKLEPMSPRDRAIIHGIVQGIKGVRSYSIGEGNARRLVIAIAKDEKKESGD